MTGNRLLACDPRERRTFQVPRSKPPPLAVVVDFYLYDLWASSPEPPDGLDEMVAILKQATRE